MTSIFETACRPWPASFPALVLFKPPPAHIGPPQGAIGNDLIYRQRLGNFEKPFRRSRDRILESLFRQTVLGGDQTLDRLTAPILVIQIVDPLPDSFPYDATIFALAGSLRLLSLEDRKASQNDQGTNQHTSRGRNESHPDDKAEHADSASDNSLPPSANTRYNRRQGSDEGSPPRERRARIRSFNPYGPRKSTIEINNGIKDLLLRYSVAEEGYIYGFHHPDDRILNPSPGDDTGTTLIKIGRSKNHAARMKQIGKKCRYVPHMVFAHLMPHHVRVERVVHMQLHNSRLRDVGCTGCGARHEEWFQVDVGRAEHLVMLWKAFAGCLPYDEEGTMLPVWRERLEQLDLDDEDCWEVFVHGAPLVQPVAVLPYELEAEAIPNTWVEDRIDPPRDGAAERSGHEEG